MTYRKGRYILFIIFMLLVAHRIVGIGSVDEEEKALDERKIAEIESDFEFIRKASEGDIETVEQQLYEGIDINIKDKYGMTALMWAAFNGQLEMVEFLLKNGADVNIRKGKGGNALFFALMSSDTRVNKEASLTQTEIIRRLLEADAKVNIVFKTNSIRTPLEMAVLSGNVEVVKLLFQYGVDNIDTFSILVYPTPKTGEYNELVLNPLMIASALGYADITKFLLEQGADVNIKNKNGHTPLLALFEFSEGEFRLEIVNILIEYGADVNTYIKEKKLTPLNGVIVYGDIEVVKAIIEAGANINFIDEDYILTSLMVAVNAEKKSVVKLLLERGADGSIKDNKGRTAMYYAKKKKNKEIITLLEDYGYEE